MTKLRLQISVLVCLLLHFELSAQNEYRLTVRSIDKDSSFLANDIGIPPSFSTRFSCQEYVNKLPSLLQGKGYVTASLDSVRYDSSFAYVVLFAGDIYKWAQVDASEVDIALLQAIGWRERMFTDKPMDFSQVAFWQNKILGYLENSGYPFARVYLDSLQMDKEKVWARMKLDKGPLYKIDSIRIIGNAKISNDYLQRYLDIRNGSIFSREKLVRISRRMKELSYVEETQPSKLIWLGNGSILEMYLKQKRSSQVNVLVGFLPNNDQLSSKKLLVTGEANMNFKNALGAGETIGLNWQQLQVRSPRLNFLFQYPYLFHSPVGLDFSFDMFRKDSTFSNINMQLGAQYVLNIHQSGKLFIQRFQTIVNGINTNYILQNRRLPDEADVSAVNLGLDYELNNTNYRLNPTSGNELRIITTVGTKKLKRNNLVLELKDPGDPAYDFGKLYDTMKLKTYQFRVKATAAKYFPVGKQNKSTVKTAINAGFFQSGNVFRNELFQIGGYKTLRGFDEESQYLSQFAIGTVEYRLLIDQNSYFYVLADGGWGRNNSQNSDVNYTYFGTGVGLAFDAKAGIFNLAWAVGKRNDTEFNLRQSKIHIGFISYF
ncbi:MAG: BamA/TamA family outer membrane protein [Chitinophagaceae bacterium]|nr:BamA/TamA family outer membrane protein [Chitinophagaceae bacterium]